MDRKNIEINPLLEVYSNYIDKIDLALQKELELYLESEFCEPLKYALDGGKRIRPIILLLASECVGNIDDNVYAGACAMYAFEKEIPKISKTKIEGLKNFYGLDNKNSIQYFEEHMTADIRHAASWEKIIDNSSKSDAELLEIAKKSIDAQNLLLDSCYEAYC